MPYTRPSLLLDDEEETPAPSVVRRKRNVYRPGTEKIRSKFERDYGDQADARLKAYDDFLSEGERDNASSNTKLPKGLTTASVIRKGALRRQLDEDTAFEATNPDANTRRIRSQQVQDEAAAREARIAETTSPYTLANRVTSSIKRRSAAGQSQCGGSATRRSWRQGACLPCPRCV